MGVIPLLSRSEIMERFLRAACKMYMLSMYRQVCYQCIDKY
jgi:hypothetical protein